MPYTVADYERDAEAYCQRAAAAQLAWRSGQRPAPDLDAEDDDWDFLFGTDLLEQLAYDVEEPNRRRFLLTFCLVGRLRQVGERELRALAAGYAGARVVWKEESVPYHLVPLRLANLAEPHERHELAEAAAPTTERLNGIRRELHELWLQEIVELGHRDVVAFWDELLGLRLDLMAELANYLLPATEGPYQDTLVAALGLAGLTPGDATSADLPALVRGPEFDPSFPSRDLIPQARRALRDFGIRLEEQSELHLQPDAPPERTLGSFCRPLHVPREVYLALVRQGGWRDLATLLELLGRAEHLAHVDPALPMPYRWLGDTAVGWGYGFLLGELVLDPLWPAGRLDLGNDGADFRQRAALAWLIELRRAATSVLYEPSLWRVQPGGWEELHDGYARAFGSMLGVHHSPTDALDGLERPFAGLQRLRGLLFAGQLRRYLVKEFDREWFRAPRAATFLVELWREGTRYTVDDLIRFMGDPGYDPAPLLDLLREALGVTA